MPPEAISDLEADDAEHDYSYWPENEESLSAFLLIQTQWKYGAMGGTLGLDYNAVDVVLKRHKFDNADKVFQELQLMEFAALPLMNKKWSHA